MHAVMLLRIVLPCCFLLILSCAPNPTTMQVVKGKLRPCPSSPNCVSSEGGPDSATVAPLSFTGNPEAAWTTLKASIGERGGTIREEGEHYLWASFATPFFRFVDDMEFRMDEGEKCIHLSSRSRVGYSDFGQNRRRVEQLRSTFQERQGQGKGAQERGD